MRDLAILTFMTLDGVMQGPSSPKEDPSGSFTQGGWAAPYWGEVMAQVRAEAMSEPYDILFGRKTYELFASHFPENGADDPESRMLNEARKYVVTSTMTDLAWQNSAPISGDIPEEVRRLKRMDGPLIQVHGSRALIQTLIAYDLIDEFRLWTFPVVVGTGAQLFGPQTERRDLSLVKSAQTANGVVMSIYRRAGTAQS
ncbi:MAG: dihydrofolate reductase family protein [Pseudomonadota bacterium]